MQTLLKSFALALGCGAIVVSMSNSHAEQHGFTLNPNVGLYEFDTDDIDGSAFGSLGLGYQFKGPWGVELNGLTADADQENTNQEVDIDELRLDALYNFKETGKFQPYAAFGIGNKEFGAPNPNADIDETAINAGVGFKTFFNDVIAFRADLRAIDGDDSGTDLALAAGLEFLFGASDKPKKAPAPQVAKVADTDGDGVADSADSCPTTPAGVAVDSRGCALDDDADGVPNYLDSCLNSEAGSKVDAKGCYIIISEAKEIELEVQFATNSDEVTEDYMNQIKAVADFMREYPLTKAVIEGHTDDRGAAAYNQQLSQRRAQSIADIIVNRFKVPAARISAVGYGEEKPKASNDNATGRAINRRVIAVINAIVEKRAE